MLNEFHQIKDQLKDPLSVELAIWYHDAVYETRAKDNEEKSAEMAKAALARLGLDEALGRRVEDLILATKHTAPSAETDEQLFIDLDLSILGKPKKEFDEYEKGIRREYHWVPEETFASVRAEILRSLLNRPTIYGSAYFQEKFEKAARRNLTAAVNKLVGREGFEPSKA